MKRAILFASMLWTACDGRTIIEHDASAIDAGAIDAGWIDAGWIDAGWIDAGALDAGWIDAGSTDAAMGDASTPIDGGRDAGSAAMDAGHDAGSTAVVDAGIDAGIAPRADHHIHIDVDNFCRMTVSPAEITVPPGQTAYFDWHNHSADYAIDVWMSYGGGYTELPTGATWDEPIGHCSTPLAHDEHADISTACSSHRFLIHCL